MICQKHLEGLVVPEPSTPSASYSEDTSAGAVSCAATAAIPVRAVPRIEVAKRRFMVGCIMPNLPIWSSVPYAQEWWVGCALIVWLAIFIFVVLCFIFFL